MSILETIFKVKNMKIYIPILSNLFTRTTYNAQVMIVVPDTNAATAIYEAIKYRTKADVDAHQIQEIPAAEVQTTEETP